MEGIILMDKIKIFYEDSGETHVATGNIISEDDFFIEINDRFEGKISIGKRYIIKRKKDGVVDGNVSRR